MRHNVQLMIGRGWKGAQEVLRYVAALAATLFFLFPILWITLTALKSGEWLYKSPPIWVPPNPTLRHFTMFAASGGLEALANTLLVAGSATLLSLLICSLAAYGLARYRVGGDNLPFYILSQRFVPPAAVIFPFLLLFRALRWMDTAQALITVYLTFNLPYAVWMMRGFFLEVPREIEESALVDGCSPFGAFWRVALPLTAPGLVATGVFCFIFSWTEFFFAVCLTRSRMETMSKFLAHAFGQLEVQWGPIASTSVMAMVPMFLMTLVLQRYLVRGLTLGAVK